MQQLRKQDGESQEIDLFDMIEFLGRNGRTILGGGLLGLGFASVLSGLAPPVYEADVIVRMAQAPVSNANVRTSTVGDVETPALLTERLKNPATYTEKSMRACAADGTALRPEHMASLIKVTVSRSTPTVVIKVQRNNPDLVSRCLNGVFEMISEQQAELKRQRDLVVANALGVLRANMKEYQTAFKSLSKPDQATAVVMMGELAGFINQINHAETLLSMSEPTRLISLAYPQLKGGRLVQVVGGAALGVLLGFVIALLVELRKKWRNRQVAA